MLHGSSRLALNSLHLVTRVRAGSLVLMLACPIKFWVGFFF